MRLPDDLTPEAILRAKERRGLSYKAIADACGVTVQSVWYWSHGDRTPQRRYHAALRHVLYGREPVNDRTVFASYSGNRYRGEVVRLAEQTALVRITLRTTGRPKEVRMDPRTRVVLLNVRWADDVCARRGLGSLREAADAGRVVLRDQDFETQALANTLVRYSPDVTVDRGVPGPDGL